MLHLRNKKFILPTVFILSLLSVFYIGFLVGRNYQPSEGKTLEDSIILRQGLHGLVNPLIACENATDSHEAKELSLFKKKLSNFIAEKTRSGMVTEISLFFRDFNDGSTIEINPDSEFEPASLNKIPLMLAYLKIAEKNPGILNKKLIYEGKVDHTKEQYFKPQKTLKPGNAYTVDELIYLMIAESDNNSWLLLADNLNPQLLFNVYKDLHINFTIGPSNKWLTTIKMYSTFMRALYSATYLNADMSEKALEIMSEGKFPYGIISGVPRGITVANKFGERGVQGTEGPLLQLHDFGIIYYPMRPYLLCVMTKGNNYVTLERTIHDLSQLIFNEYDAINANIYTKTPVTDGNLGSFTSES